MVIRYKTSCISCKVEVQNRYFPEHKCKVALTLQCHFCGRNSMNLNSAAQHLVRCGKNPDRINLSHLDNAKNFDQYRKRVQTGEIKHLNQYLKADLMGLPRPEVTLNASEKIKEANRNRVWTPESRKKLSESMKRAVDLNPEAYSSSNRGRTKQIIFDGIKFQGNWELDFYKWCLSKNIRCLRNTEGFKYQWNGERTYYPDFYLPEQDLYVEVKGYKTERDSAKWEQFPKRLIIVQKQDMIDIKNDVYSLLS